ncbi:hypothetical protein [Amycolatopsis cihanbeyliensis]|uniref:Uncharacterized protein n=1 Tax=Amycolatopsis cihanbeyliensis TaxID=1128664 RepID=A0A542DM23_AMYCI|nr:hypothetical protein [Amycolatopsis cihanbeyliensis]TQJ04034.1 hypothetical protein FB471_3814 [Amycolatopsis cihanbeyliensis]
MSWQEELRRLDGDLAEGRLDIAQHRKLRDELLAAVSGGIAPSPFPSPVRQEDTAYRQQATPTPDPVPQESAPGTRPERPARPPSAAALLGSDVSHTAPSPADERPTEWMTVPPGLRRPGRPRSGSAPDTGPATPAGSVPTHPPAPHRPPEPRPSRAVPIWLLITLATFLVLAGLVGGVWWLGTDPADDAGSQAAPSAGPSTTPSATPSTTGAPANTPPLAQRLPELPGVPNENNSTMSVDKAVQLGVLSPRMGTICAEAGATEVIYRSSAAGTDGYLLLVVPTGSAAEAATVTDALRASARTIGFTAVDPGRTDGRQTLTGSNETGRMAATWYTSGQHSVAIWVSQGLADDPAGLERRLNRTVDEVEAVLGPG